MKERDLLTLDDLSGKTLKEIYEYAKKYEIPYYSKMNKKELAHAVIKAHEKDRGFFEGSGVLEMMGHQEHAFLRPINYSESKEDVYVSNSQIKRFGLRNGDYVTGKVRPPKQNERYNGLMQVDLINGRDPEKSKSRPHFPALTALYPDRQIRLETSSDKLTTRMIDIIAPIGFGQRGLIVAPPKAGKTTMLKDIAGGISANYPEAKLIILLIGERPEEVTDIERNVDGEVVSSTFDQEARHHINVAELVLERAQRLAEDREDVIILMDSLTRLARAYNIITTPSGRTLSGGIDPAALYPPKRFFGSARNIEEGGSITILATALVDTGSRMDEVIYEEFKGTGNMELHLSRDLAERRIFPAIDIKQSSTRKEELLLEEEKLKEVWKLRKALGGNPLEYTGGVINLLKNTKDNEEFYQELQKREE